jgi:hypothetical protein
MLYSKYHKFTPVSIISYLSFSDNIFGKSEIEIGYNFKFIQISIKEFFIKFAVFSRSFSQET